MGDWVVCAGIRTLFRGILIGRLGEDVPRGGVVIAQLVGDACEAIGQRPMWETVEHLNAAQSRAAAQRLQTIMDRHFAYADTVQEGHYRQLSALEVAKLVRAVEQALTQHKPVPVASKPRRAWRPRRVMAKSKEGAPRKRVP